MSLLVVSTCIIADQTSKVLASILLEPRTTVYLLGPMVRFEYTENRGGFLSWGWWLPEEIRFWTFTVITGLLLFGLLVLAMRPGMTTLTCAALSAIAGGGFSNIIDRLQHGGAVIDFIGLNTVIINLADIIISLGMVLAAISWLLFKHFGVDLRSR